MRGSVSIEVLLLAVAILAALTVVGQQVSRTVGMVQTTDPLLLGKMAGEKVLSGVLQADSCQPCEVKMTVYVPAGGDLRIRKGEIDVYVLGTLVYTSPAPTVTEVNLGGGWHTLTLAGTSSGVIVS